MFPPTSFILKNSAPKEIEKLTKDELILSLFCQKNLDADGSNEELIQKFKETYKDQADLITKAAQGDAKALRRLRWICGLKVIT